MGLVTVTPRGDSDGSIVRQLGDNIDSTVRTYTYDTAQESLTIWNKGYVPIVLNVGSYVNITIAPLTTWGNDVDFSSFTIKTSSGTSEIQVTAREYDNKPVYKKDLAGQIPTDLLQTIEGHTAQLVDKAQQIDLGDKSNLPTVDKTSFENSIKELYLLLLTKLSQTQINLLIGFADINKNLSLIDSTMLSASLLQMIAGTAGVNVTPALLSVVSGMLADLSVIPAKTSFIKDGNLFDSSKVVTGGYYNYNTGIWTVDATYDSSGFTTVLPNNTYYIKNSTLTEGHVALFDKNNIYIVGYYLVATSNVMTVVVPNNNKIAYMTVMLKPAQIASTVISIGNSAGNYSLAKKLLLSSIIYDIKIPKVQSSDTDFISEVNELYDSSKIVTGGYFHYQNGAWTVDATYDSTGYTTAEANATYYISCPTLTSVHIAYFDIYNKFVAGLYATATNNIITLVAPSNDAIAYVTIMLTPSQVANFSITPAITWYNMVKPIQIANIKGLADKFTAINAVVPGLQWKGKAWSGFGTSLTNIASEGRYPTSLATISGLNFTNYGLSGGRINTEIYNKIMATNLVGADLITVEGSVNDQAMSVPLGVVGDTTSATFAGAIYAIANYIYTNSTATLIFLTDHVGRYYWDGGTFYADCQPTKTNSLGLKQIDYIKMVVDVCKYLGVPCIEAGQKCGVNLFTGNLYLQDHIHLNDLGGEQYANTVWSELKDIECRVLV